MKFDSINSLIFGCLSRFYLFLRNYEYWFVLTDNANVLRVDVNELDFHVFRINKTKQLSLFLRKLILFPVLSFASLVLIGCSETIIPSEIALTPASSKSLSAPSEVTTSSTSNEEYQLGIGDKVRILVYGEEDLSGEFTIDNRGSVDLPLIGEAPAAGKTIRQLEQTVVARFKQGYLLDPRVSIDVLNFRPFFIQGEIKTAGEYPYKSGITALDAVAIAGGYSYRAKKNLIYIRRAGSGEERAYDPSTARVMVQPGDNIRVPERFF